MTDRDLINELVKRGILTQAVADKILKDAEFSHRSPENLIYERRLADEIAVTKVKSELLGVPYKKVDINNLNPELVRIIPRETAQTYRFIPLEQTKDMLIIGMLRPDDAQAQEVLRFIAKQNKLSLGVYLITYSDFFAVWRFYFPYKTEIEAAVREIGARTEEERTISLEEGGSADEAPIIKIVASTLRQAVEIGASDIHIEPQRNRLRIRFRIYGELEEMTSLPSSLIQPIISRVKVLARLKLDETRIPQDGRFRTVVFGRDIDYRVATFPTPSGEKVAIRVLDPSTGLKSFEDLGLSDYNFKLLNEAIMRPYGMILISGPTGSGKTTTLYAVLQRLNEERVNIVTLEDPVEYFMEGINQSQVKPEIGYDFASGLRQILRQDPDVIMVGEIRDGETASLAVNAALTGHIVLSTIHTNNSIGVIPRLIDLGVPPFLLSSALNLMLAQRLVLQLCPQCKIAEKAPSEVVEIIEKNLEQLPSSLKAKLNFEKPYRIYRPFVSSQGVNEKPNCKTCGGKGTIGRIAVFEIFRMTRELGDLISSSFTESKLWDEAKRQGILTLRQDGIIKALEGKISMEEVLKETAE